MPLFFFSKVRI